MSYPYVQAKFYTPGGLTEPRAIVIHMAAGGGTVAWLQHPTNDNSSHFVIEYSGRIVQMVRDSDADHSLHIGRLYGPPGVDDYGIFSLDTAKAVLGGGIFDPNRYLFAVEIEGYAANGPNAAQATSLGALVQDLRARHPSIRGLLGHRDFQIKVCPGGLIPWAALGGHGLFLPETTTGDDMAGLGFTITKYGGGTVTVTTEGTWAIVLKDGGHVGLAKGTPKRYVAFGRLDVPFGTAPNSQEGYLVGDGLAVLLARNVAPIPDAPPKPPATVTVQIDGVTDYTKVV